MAEADISNLITVAMEDKVSKPLGKINETLTSTVELLTKLGKKFDDISKTNLSTLAKEIDKVKNASVDIKSPAGRFSVSKDSKASQKSIDKAIDAHSDSVAKQTELLNKELEHFDELIAAKLEKDAAYIKDINNRISKRTRAKNLNAKTRNIDAKTALIEVQKQLLQESGQRRFTNDWSGGKASIISGLNQRLKNQHGVVGLISRAGERLGANNSTWFGRTFGGVVKSGTSGGLGVNAGALALGGFTAAVGAAVKAMYDFRKAALDAYGSMQKLAVNMEVVYGSKVESSSAFEGIQKYATKSPFGISQTTEMAVLLKQSGVYASELQKTLEMIGDVSSGNEEKMKRIANNYAQIQAIGHASMLDMRQFAYAGLPIYEEVAKTMKTDQASLRNMISDGKVTAEVIEKTFKRMTGEGGTFNGAVSKGAKTRAAREINLQDIKSVSMANWGDYFWNTGSSGNSLAQSILGAKENFWKIIGSVGKSASISQNANFAESSKIRLDTLREAYAQALAANNEPLAKSLGKEIQEYRNSIINEEAVVAALAEKGMREMGVNDKTIVSNEETEDVLFKLKNILEKEGRLIYYSSGYEEALSEERIKHLLESAEAGYLNTNAMDEMTRSLGFSSIGAEMEVNQLLNYLKNTMTESEFYARLEAFSKQTGKGEKAVAIYTSLLTKLTRESEDYYNKQAGAADSLASWTAKFKSDWEQSEEGQRQKKREYESKYSEVSGKVNAMIPYWDNSTHSFNQEALKKKKKESLEKGEVFSIWDTVASINGKDGFITNAKKLSLGKDTIQMDRKNTNLNQLRTNIDDAIFALTEAGVGGEKYVKELQKFQKSYKSLDYTSASKDINDFSESLEKLLVIFKKSDNEDIRNIGTSLALQREGITNVSPMAKDKGDEFTSLWKRIFAGATGYDASKIGARSPETMLSEYVKDSVKNIGGGSIASLISSGLTGHDIGKNLAWTSNRAQGDAYRSKVSQIDWGSSITNMMENALSMNEPVKQAAASLSGFSNAMKKELSVYEKLTTDMYTVGEDWSTISKMSRDEKERLQNAFQSNALIDSTGKTYSMDYSSEKDEFVISDPALEQFMGMTFDEVRELARGGKLDKETQKIVNGLTLNKEGIIKKLDVQRKSLENLEKLVSTANQIANATYELQKQAAEKRGASAAGSDIGVMALEEAMRKAMKGSKADKSQSSKALREMQDSQTRELLKPVLSKFGSSLATIDTNKTSYEEFAKANPELAKSIKAKDYDNYRKAASAYQNSNSEIERYNILVTLMEQFEDLFIELINAAGEVKNANISGEGRTNADKMTSMSKDLEDLLAHGSYRKGVYTDEKGEHRNSYKQQMLLNSLGMGDEKFGPMAQGLANSAFIAQGKYYGTTKNLAVGDTGSLGLGNKIMMDQLRKRGLSELKDDNEAQARFETAIDSGDMTSAASELGDNWDKIVDKSAEYLLNLADAGLSLKELGRELGSIAQSATGDLISSSFETMGESLASGSDSAEALQQNFKKMVSSMFSEAGKLLTLAGLNMAAKAGSFPMILAGLGIAAAGAGMSFLSGILGAEEKDNDKGNSELERLLKVKEDLQELLKQAREDSVYYEKTVRHKNAISANADFTTKKVNDAIITPSGDVISTHPDDYLIATKTPHSLVNAGKGGAPTINFSVVDKSTGIKVTQQKSSYDEDKNEIDFEAIIESKVTEIIATSKGDEAFNARQARINGRSVIA